MARWRFDRISIFFGIIGLLFIWDLIYFLGITDPTHFPHPFRLFNLFTDSELFRGFRTMVRQIIFLFVPAGIVGITAGCLILRNSPLTYALLRFLRIGLWLPFVIIFALPDKFALGLTIVALCSCYHYLIARSYLELHGNAALAYVGRETFLQAWLISLIAQIWGGPWKWYEFSARFVPSDGFKCLAMLIVLAFLVNWFFRSNFDLTAQRRKIILAREFDNANWNTLRGTFLITIVCLLIWLTFSQLWPKLIPTSPLDVLAAGYTLFKAGELWGDIGISLLEIAIGITLGAALVLPVLVVISNVPSVRGLFFRLLPLTYISPIVLWLFAFMLVPSWIYFWHKVVAVGFLAFFPLIQAMWALHDRSWPYRLSLAIDDALPIAFVMMLFGELMAATAGLGFMMTVASATYQIDKSLVGFLVTTALLITLSAALRSIAKHLNSPAASTEVVPAEAT
jgi:ABC-type nitrate/sulfonate/bicarbonate transport system permease component